MSDKKKVVSPLAESNAAELRHREMAWLSGVLAALDMGDGTPEVVAYVNLLGDEYPVQMVGQKAWARAQKLAKKYEVPIRFYREVKAAEDGLSLSYQSWVNTKDHGEVENSSTYIHEEDGKRLMGYDGDEDFDNTKSIGQQLNRSYTLPYVRYQAAGDYTEVRWLSETPEGKLSNPVKGAERVRGEIRKHKGKDGKEWPVFAMYLAKELPSNGKHYLLQDRLDQAYSNQDWDRFNTILEAQKVYKAGMKDRAVDIKTCKNGKKYVYFMQFNGFVVFSVIPEKELAPHIQESLEATRRMWNVYNAFKQQVNGWVTDLTEIKEAIDNGLLKGDEMAWDCYHTMLRNVADRVGVRAPWLFKAKLKPFYRDLFLGKKVAPVSLFNDEGDIL